jgi:UMP-CMP kinase
VTYLAETAPVIAAFEAQGKVRRVDSCRSLEHVSADVAAVFAPPRPKAVFVLGGPGSGKGAILLARMPALGIASAQACDRATAPKGPHDWSVFAGTQCAMIVERFGFHHLSAGDLLRAEKESGTAEGEMIKEYIKDGKIVPVEVTVRLLKKAMAESGKQRFLIDGFPRNTNNVDGWNSVMGDSVELQFVLFLECTEEEMEKRLLERGKTSGRSDDNIESIKKRFVTYLAETAPVIAAFEAQGKVRRVDSCRSLEHVSADVAAVFAPGPGQASPSALQLDAEVPRVTTPKSEYSTKAAAGTVEDDPPNNTALVFVKPHAVNDKVSDGWTVLLARMIVLACWRCTTSPGLRMVDMRDGAAGTVATRAGGGFREG